jgi:hypothetical protein
VNYCWISTIFHLCIGLIIIVDEGLCASSHNAAEQPFFPTQLHVTTPHPSDREIIAILDKRRFVDYPSQVLLMQEAT